MNGASPGGQGITTNSAFLLSSEVYSKVFRMILVMAAARILGDVAFGQYSFALAYASLFLMLTDLGVHQLLIREVARDRTKADLFLSNALTIKSALSVATLGIMILVAQFMKKPADVRWTVYILSVSILLGSYVGLFQSLFNAFQRMKYDAAANAIQTTVLTGLGVAILLLGGGIWALALAFLCSRIVSLLYAAFITRTRFAPVRLGYHAETFRYLFREGLPIGINYFFSTVYSYADTLMLSFMSGDAAVGWYTAAYRFRFALQFMGMSIVRAVYPALSAHYTADRDRFIELFRKTFKVMLLLGTSMACILSLLADKIIVLVYGDAYSESIAVLRVLIWVMALVFITFTLGATTRASNHQRFTATVVGIGAFVNLGLNLILIPVYAHIGAAFATLLTEAFVLVAHVLFLWRLGIRPPFLETIPKIVLIQGALMGFHHAFRDGNLLLLLAGYSVILVLLVMLLRYFSMDEFQFFMHFRRQTRG